MAYTRLISGLRPRFLLVLAASLTVACEEGPPPASAPSGPPEEVRTFDPKTWGEIYGRTLQLHVPVPEVKKWRFVESNQGQAILAVHAATHSKLSITFWEERELQNRSTCRAGAERDGLLPKGRATVLEEHVDALPGAYDTRFWVALADAKPGARIVGHVYATGAFLKRCYFFDFESSVPTDANSDVLGARLATARVRMLGGMTLDPPRIGDEGHVPQEKRP